VSAPIKVSVKVDWSQLLGMARTLAARSPVPYKRILLMETASIIKIAALRSRIASAAEIKRDAVNRLDTEYKSPDGTIVTINKHKSAGRTWLATGDRRENQGLAYRAKGTSRSVWLMVYESGPSRGHHLPDEAWMAYLIAIDDKQSAVKALIVTLLRRRGLTRLSWIQMGDALGIPLSTVSPQGSLQEQVARAARGPRGRIFQNGTAQVTITSRSLIIRIRNESPLAIKQKGQQELDRAAAQRLKGFVIAMNKGIFDDMKAASARWRGIIVRQP
jgi:hypothetical protein